MGVATAAMRVLDDVRAEFPSSAAPTQLAKATELQSRAPWSGAIAQLSFIVLKY